MSWKAVQERLLTELGTLGYITPWNAHENASNALWLWDILFTVKVYLLYIQNFFFSFKYSKEGLKPLGYLCYFPLGSFFFLLPVTSLGQEIKFLQSEEVKGIPLLDTYISCHLNRCPI